MAQLEKALKIRVTAGELLILKHIMAQFGHRTMADAVRMVFCCSGVYTDTKKQLEEKAGEKLNTKEPRK